MVWGSGDIKWYWHWFADRFGNTFYVSTQSFADGNSDLMFTNLKNGGLWQPQWFNQKYFAARSSMVASSMHDIIIILSSNC